MAQQAVYGSAGAVTDGRFNPWDKRRGERPTGHDVENKTRITTTRIKTSTN